jgi:hypothetical protein
MVLDRRVETGALSLPTLKVVSAVKPVLIVPALIGPQIGDDHDT